MRLYFHKLIKHLPESHAQPEPNCVAAACLNSSENASNDPKSLSINLSSSPSGFFPPFGLMDCQKNSWFHAYKESARSISW